eukprot:82200_1
MQYQVRKFIDLTKNKINDGKPWFHDPSILDALQDYNISQTPASNTYFDDISEKDLEKYIYKYMKTREEIYNEAVEWQKLDGSTGDESILNKAAGLLWVDEQFGAICYEY